MTTNSNARELQMNKEIRIVVDEKGTSTVCLNRNCRGPRGDEVLMRNKCSQSSLNESCRSIKNFSPPRVQNANLTSSKEHFCLSKLWTMIHISANQFEVSNWVSSVRENPLGFKPTEKQNVISNSNVGISIPDNSQDLISSRFSRSVPAHHCCK